MDRLVNIRSYFGSVPQAKRSMKLALAMSVVRALAYAGAGWTMGWAAYGGMLIVLSVRDYVRAMRTVDEMASELQPQVFPSHWCIGPQALLAWAERQQDMRGQGWLYLAFDQSRTLRSELRSLPTMLVVMAIAALGREGSLWWVLAAVVVWSGSRRRWDRCFARYNQDPRLRYDEMTRESIERLAIVFLMLNCAWLSRDGSVAWAVLAIAFAAVYWFWHRLTAVTNRQWGQPGYESRQRWLVRRLLVLMAGTMIAWMVSFGTPDAQSWVLLGATATTFIVVLWDIRQDRVIELTHSPLKTEDADELMRWVRKTIGSRD